MDKLIGEGRECRLPIMKRYKELKKNIHRDIHMQIKMETTMKTKETAIEGGF